MIGLWLVGLLKARTALIIGSAVSVGLMVALISSLGVFLYNSAASMTTRAIATVPVDWQVQLAPGASVDAVKQAVQKAVAPSNLEVVGYAGVDGFEATTG